MASTPQVATRPRFGFALEYVSDIEATKKDLESRGVTFERCGRECVGPADERPNCRR